MINKQPITTTLVGMNVAVYVVMVLTGVSPVNPTSATVEVGSELAGRSRWGRSRGAYWLPTTFMLGSSTLR